MGVYLDDVIRTFAGESRSWSATAPAGTSPSLAGLTFSFEAVAACDEGSPTTTIAVACSVSGTTISWTTTAAQTISRGGQRLAWKLKCTTTGQERVWKAGAWVIDT